MSSDVEECAPYEKPTIVLIATEFRFFEILDDHLNKVYNILPLDSFDTVDFLPPSMRVKLFFVNTDRPWIGLKEILDKIKSSELYQNVPVIGLSLKQHFPQIDDQVRHQFEDILLLPCGSEDLLTRVDIWVKTYDVICEDEPKQHTFSIDLP